MYNLLYSPTHIDVSHIHIHMRPFVKVNLAHFCPLFYSHSSLHSFSCSFLAIVTLPLFLAFSCQHTFTQNHTWRNMFFFTCHIPFLAPPGPVLCPISLRSTYPRITLYSTHKHSGTHPRCVHDFSFLSSTSISTSYFARFPQVDPKLHYAFISSHSHLHP